MDRVWVMHVSWSPDRTEDVTRAFQSRKAAFVALIEKAAELTVTQVVRPGLVKGIGDAMAKETGDFDFDVMAISGGSVQGWVRHVEVMYA